MIIPGHNVTVSILPNPRLDLTGLGHKDITILFCRESRRGHTIIVDLVRFQPYRHLVVNAEIDTRSLQLSDVLTSHYNLMSRIVEKHIKHGQ